MNYSFDYSVIIPHCNSVRFLPKLFSSIPTDGKIEVLLVDNSPEPITVQQVREVGVMRDFTLLFSEPVRGAGGARNVGIEKAQGKWLIFADADDYFAEGAFDVFFSKVDSDAEIIYTGMGGIYLDTGEKADRGDIYINLVRDYLCEKKSEDDLRLGFASPCCKMISHDLVERHNLRYDEIRAGNDIYFSLTSGFYATKVEAVDFISYIATVSKGTLTKRRDYEVIKARLYSKLHCNQFLKGHGYSQRQHSVMFALNAARNYGVKAFFEFCGMIIKFHQNPFVGCGGWFTTIKKKKTKHKDDKYFVK